MPQGGHGVAADVSDGGLLTPVAGVEQPRRCALAGAARLGRRRYRPGDCLGARQSTNAPLGDPLGHSAARTGSTTASGSRGGVRNGGFSKLNMSSIGSAFASLRVSAGRSKRVSMNLRIEV